MNTLRQKNAAIFPNCLGLALALAMCLANFVRAQTIGHVRAYADALTFPFPVEMLPANDGTGRMFVVSQNGIISVFPNVATTSSAQVFLNIGPTGSNNRIVFSSGAERGLLGMALHPDFRNNRQFFLYYTTLNAGITRMVLARYFADPNNANQALLTEERLLFFDKNQNNDNHNGGKIAFGPDGFLYLSIGDGGGGGDPQNNAQNRNNLFGKMLRIDVNGDDFPADANRNYRIPASNPFASSGGSPEIFAWGLRNTWKFSFDQVTGRIWGGDVGQGSREEINIVTSGGNFGWRKYEGNNTHNAGDPVPSAPAATFPVFDYNSGGGASITGGYVYRGTAIPGLEGRYVYGDYVRGTMASLAYNGTTATNTNHYTATDGGTTINIASFGEDERGELYFIGRNTSRIYRLTNTANAPSGQTVQGFGKWSTLATGTNGVVRAVITDASGNVYVAGSFNTAGGIPANNIARWNPNTGWTALGAGLSGTVNALAFRGSDLIVGGAFANAGAGSANNVAVWNGTTWAALETGVDGPVRALAVSGSDIFVGGAFASPSNNVARWNGTAWSGLDGGTNNEIRSMVYDVAQQALFVGGNFSLAGTTSAASVASWSSVNGWQALGSGLGGFANALALLPNGDLVAGGSFTTAGGNNLNRIARWNGTVWSGFADGIGATVNALAVSRGRLLAGGLFALADGRVVNNVALWDPAAGGWNALGPGTAVGVNAGVNALAVVGNFAFAGGGQINAGALTVNNIARLELPIIWNNGWTPATPIAGENVAIMSTNTQPGNFVCNDLTVNSGVVLSLESGQAITVSGALDYSGATIEVLTGGSFVQASTSTAVTTTSTSRFRAVRTDGRNAIGYNLISSPVGGETINSIGLNTYPNNRFRYSPVPVAGQTWVPLAGTAALARGMGYTYVPAQGSNNTLTFENTDDGLVGQPGNGNLNVPLTFAGNNFNLIGNPYPSPINLIPFLTANTSVISGTAWFWQDNNNGTGSGTYVAHNLVTPPIQVAVGQGFFVLASASGNVAFTNNLRTTGTPTFYRTEGDMERFRLGVNSANGGDELWVAFAPHFTTGFEKGFDAQKFEGSISLSLAAVVGNERLAIAALPNHDRFELPLTLFVQQAGEHHFIAREVETPTKQKLFLEDRQTGEFYYLQTGRNHPLNLQAGHYRNRFYLRSASEVAGQAFLTGETAGAYAFGRDLYVETNETAQVTLYNTLGTELLRFGQIPAGGLRRLAANVPTSGVYVVKVATASGSVEKRVWLEK